MSSLPGPDPLVTLWQTAPKTDEQSLLQDLHRLNRSHRRLNQVVLAIMCGTSLLLIFKEATGRVTTHGALSVMWILGLILGLVWHRRARCTADDLFALDTVTLLRSMIGRAKSDLLVARCLYAGVPCGAVVGFLAMKFAGVTSSPTPIAVNAHLQAIQTVAGVAVLLTMIVAGVILAGSRRLQVRSLSEKLRLIDSEL